MKIYSNLRSFSFAYCILKNDILTIENGTLSPIDHFEAISENQVPTKYGVHVNFMSLQPLK